MMLVMPNGQLSDEASDRIENGIEGIAVSAQNHPGGKCSGSFFSEGIETLVDNDPGVGFASARAFDGIGDASVDRVGDGFCKRALEPGRRSEMVQQIGVGASDFGGHCFQGYSLGALFEQQSPGSRKRGRPAFFRAKACSSY